MRAWVAPYVNGQRIDAEEVELPTTGLSIDEHSLPWAKVAYRFEYEPGEREQIRTLPWNPIG